MLDLDTTAKLDTTVMSSAARRATFNHQQNLLALQQTQPNLVVLCDAENPQCLFARDGTLTALVNGKWWGGCSVPTKAAAELLKTLHITASVACFLVPTHPAQIAFALTQLKAEQAILAIIPRHEDMLLALHCHDFSRDIAAHRLWFVAGDAWADELSKIFHSNPGLPLPQQFIRSALLSEDASAPLIATAQKVFTDELHRRSNLLSELRQQHAQKSSRITLAAHMHFRLWDDAGAVLQQLIADELRLDCTTIDFDDPAQASPLALAQAAAESSALITVNLTRADCGHFIHPQTPIISWLTSRPIPAFVPTFARDKFLLPDPRLLQIAKQSN